MPQGILGGFLGRAAGGWLDDQLGLPGVGKLAGGVLGTAFSPLQAGPQQGMMGQPQQLSPYWGWSTLRDIYNTGRDIYNTAEPFLSSLSAQPGPQQGMMGQPQQLAPYWGLPSWSDIAKVAQVAQQVAQVARRF
jgi:hypothetical protein